MCLRKRRRQKVIDEESEQNHNGGQPKSENGDSWKSRLRLGLSRRQLDHPDKSVASPWKSFDKSGIDSSISQTVPELTDRPIQALLEIPHGGPRPDELLKLFTADQFARPGEQRSQNPEGLLRELDFDPVLSQLCSLEV